MKGAAFDAEDAARRILAQIRRIPAGRVATYGQLARLAGVPGRARLVGRLLGRSEEPALPWHRVLNAQGRSSLPAEYAAEQQRRLAAEGVRWSCGRVSLSEFGWRAGGDAPLID